MPRGSSLPLKGANNRIYAQFVLMAYFEQNFGDLLYKFYPLLLNCLAEVSFLLSAINGMDIFCRQAPQYFRKKREKRLNLVLLCVVN